ncbi:MAG: flagellar biosynthetic protein FliO [SAR324 cluster bacterium]|nr:flagellar biosynthetic protein FliO [SAR324 cluster bacterium]
MTAFRQQFYFLVISVFLCGGLFSSTLAAPNVLQDVKVVSMDPHESIKLLFKNNFEGSPIIDFDPGLIYVRLTSTTMDTTARQFVFPKSNPIIKTIRATQNQTSTLLEIILHSRNFSLKNKIKVVTDGQYLLLNLDRQGLNVPSEQSVAKTEIAAELENRLREGEQMSAAQEEPEGPVDLADEDPPLVVQPADSWTMTLITLILSLLFLLLLLMGMLYVYNKFVSGRFPALQGKFKIRIVSTFHISPKQKIIVLEVNEQHFACGVTSNNISFLTEVKGERDQSFLKNISFAKENMDLNTNQSRAEFLSALETARKQAQQVEKVQKMQAAQKTGKTVARASDNQSKTQASENHTSASKNQSEKTVASSQKMAKREGTAPGKKFKTPVPPEPEAAVLEAEFTEDPSLQKFAKQLNQKLKSLKPIS